MVIHTIVRSGRRGVTLIEILVSMIVSGVVLVGMGALISSAASDFGFWYRVRETRFSRSLLETELTWTLRAVPPEGYRPGTWADAVINDSGVNRTVLTYDYSRNHQGGLASASSVDAWTGIVYQWGSVVYRFESSQAGMGGMPAPSFNQFNTGQLQAFCSTLKNRQRSDVLATCAQSLTFQRVALTGGASVQWTFSHY